MMARIGRQADDKIVRQVLTGHRQHFGVLVERYLPVVHAVAFAQLRNHADAEDIAQDTFLKAFQSLDTLRETSKFGKWLVTIARNKCKDLQMKRNREVPLEGRPEPAAATTPDLDRQELHGLLRQQMEQLEEGSREMLLLYYFAGKNTRDIAQLLEISTNAAEKRLQRARDALGRKLVDQLGSALAPYRLGKEGASRVMAAIVAVPVPWATVATVSSGSLTAAGAAKTVGGILAMNKVVVGSMVAVVAGIGLWWAVNRTPSTVNPVQEAVQIQPATTPEREAQPASPATSESEMQPPEDVEPVGEEAESEVIETANELTGAVIAGRVYDADTGEGIAGVEINAQPTPWSSEVPSGTAKTDTFGSYQIDRLGEAEYRVLLKEAEGYPKLVVRLEKRVLAKPDQRVDGIDFALSKGLHVTGKVVDDDGEPVCEAKINGWTDVNLNRAESNSAEDGTFILGGLPLTNSLYIQPVKEGLALRPQGPFTLTEEGLHDVVLTMSPYASIAGWVVDNVGAPLVGVRASASPGLVGQWGGQTTEPTDEEGAFTIAGLFAGTYRMSIHLPDEDQHRSIEDLPPITVEPGDEITGVVLVYKEEEGLSIAGRVVDTQDRPVRGAEVTHMGLSWDSVYTDGNGLYESARLKDGVYTLHVAHERYCTVEVEGVAAGSEVEDIVLEERGAIEGHVLQAHTGDPITEFEISELSRTPRKYGNERYLEVHDPEGRFFLAHVDCGDGDRSIYVRAAGFASASETVGGIEPGETVSGIVVRLEPSAPIQGVVVDADGEPVPGASIFPGFFPPAGLRNDYVAARSDSAGTFCLDTVPAEIEKVYAYHPKYAPGSADVDPDRTGAELLEIVLTSGGVLEGVVTVNGEPLVDEEVRIEALDLRTPTDEDGNYRFAEMMPGEMLVSVNPTFGVGESWFGRVQRKTAIIKEGGSTVLDFHFRDWDGVVEGTLTVDGQPPGPGTILVFVKSPGIEPEEDKVYAHADDSGRYRIEGVRPGPATLEVFAQFADGTGGRYTIPIEVLSSEVTHQDIDLTQ